MKLKRLELCGFKSFVDKTTIQFPEGVSAIVGPNGCGKSNIVDAIQWVTGEQSMKQLRGKSKDDVIFAGATNRSPVNMAEVSITFANDNGSVPEQFRQNSEIQVTRRLYRSGESGYFINRTPCRLKDIMHLLAGSGVGARTYSVIQQGNIGAITEAGPAERRVYIEEAAGITRYKQRKKEALAKVESTRQNLLRVMDIITEVERQMKGLARQAKKAEQYRELQARLRKLQVAMAAWDHDRYAEVIAETDRLLEQLKDTELSHGTQLDQLDAAMESIRLERDQALSRIADQETAKNELQRAADRMENDLSHARGEVERLAEEATGLAREREELETKREKLTAEAAGMEEEREALAAGRKETLERLTAEREASAGLRQELSHEEERLEEQKAVHIDLVADEARYRNNYHNATNTKQTITRRLKRAAEEVVRARREAEACSVRLREAERRQEDARAETAQLEQELTEVEGRLETTRQSLSTALREVQELELARGKVKSQLTTLRKMESSMDLYKDGVRAVLSRHKAASVSEGPVRGVLADVVRPEKSYAAAVEAVLGEALQYVLVDGMAAARENVGFLETEQKGRAGFVPLDAAVAGEAPAAVDRPLLAHVSAVEGYAPLVQNLLAGVTVAEDLDEALAIRGKNGYGRTVVTRDGRHLLLPHALLGGGGDSAGQGLLSRREQMDDLERELAEVTQKLEEAEERKSACESGLRHLEQELHQAVTARRDARQEERDAEKEVYQAASEKKRHEQALEVAELTHGELAGEEDDADQEVERYRELMENVAREVEQARATVEETAGRIAHLKVQVEAYTEKAGDLRSELTSHDARLNYLNQSLGRLAEFRQDWERQLGTLEERRKEKLEQSEAQARHVTSLEQRLAEAYHRLEQVTAELDTETRERDRIEEKLRESGSMSEKIRDERNEAQQKLRDLELEQQKRRIAQQAIAERIEETTGKALGRLRRDPEFLTIADKEERDKARAEVDGLRERIARLGDVNMAAIEEHKALEERYVFLTQQRDDLEQAIEALQKVIRKINRYTQARFTETFRDVNEKLKEIFPRLFSGGSAELILSEPDNPLETGVEYMVNPPGKKVTRMSLLSGGEKALSAIAFVFAIFLIKPASFCLMDEIDAPLDEANVHRFNELLKIIGEKSQIVMITHNKRSMEFADMLFGITMESRGVSKLVSVNLERGQAAPAELN